MNSTYPSCRTAALFLFGLVLMICSAAVAKAEVQRMDAEAAHKGAEAGELILVDIRTPEEWQDSGIGETATPLDMRDPNFLQKLQALADATPEKPIALICATGGRTGYVTKVLNSRGWQNLIDVSEGMHGSAAGPGWLARHLPIKPYVP